MNSKLLKKILQTKTMQFSVTEVKKLLDAELSKAPKEMDTDLAELCIETLSKAATVSKSGKEKTDSEEDDDEEENNNQ